MGDKARKSKKMARVGESGAAGGVEKKENLFVKFFDDVNWGKLAAAAAVGAGAGAAYAIIDQTVLHRKQKDNKLPLSTDTLERTAPDILARLTRFYQYRNSVPTQHHKNEFRRLTIEVMRQSEYLAAVYNRIMSDSQKLTPDMDIIAKYNQMKKHVKVIVGVLRTMLALVQNDEKEEDLSLTDAFNRLYECFHNRLFNVEKQFI